MQCEADFFFFLDGGHPLNSDACFLTLKSSPMVVPPMKIKHLDSSGISISRNLTVGMAVSARIVGH